MKVRIKLLEEALGSSPSNEDLMGTYIASKAPTEDLTSEEIDCERPLRASTPQGERVSIAKSESVPAGSTAEFEIECLDPGLEAMVRECLNYGTKRGLGQWRNSGKGRYEWEEL